MTFQPNLELREKVGHPFGTYIDAQGYIMLKKTTRKYHPIKEHILVAEIMYGGELPKGADVHHIDLDRTNNHPNNLMICSHSYHLIAHRWLRAKQACGNPGWRKCVFCKAWDEPENLFIGNTHNVYHRRCENEYGRQRYQRA